MESLKETPTPSIPLHVSKLIADYARRLTPLQPQADKTMVFIPADTTGLCGVSNKLMITDNDTGVHALTGTASLLDVRPTKKQFPINQDIVEPINRHMTCLLAEVALHQALTVGSEWVTRSIPGIALKSSRYFAETTGLRNCKVDTSSEHDVIAGVSLPRGSKRFRVGPWPTIVSCRHNQSNSADFRCPARLGYRI